MKDGKKDRGIHSMGARSQVSHICIMQCHWDPHRRGGEVSQVPTEWMGTHYYVKDRMSLGQKH